MSNKLNAEQILAIVEANYEVDDFAYGEFLKCTKYNETPLHITDLNGKKVWILNELGLGEVEEVAQYGGEGQGDTWWSVKYFKDHDVYIKIDGSYSSYDGTDFYYGYGREVRPQKKTITVYE